MAARRKQNRHLPSVRRHRKDRRRVGQKQTEYTFQADEAAAPLEKTPRPKPVEDTELLILRTWTDPGGIGHCARLWNDHWFVMCESREFNDALKCYGNNKLRISADTVTCLRCVAVIAW